MSSSNTRTGERIFAAVLIIFSAAALWQAYQIAGFSKLSSPGVFPMLAAFIMLLSAVFVFLQTQGAAGKSATLSVSESAADPAIVPPRVLVVSALLIAYVLAMPTLGFLLDSGLFLFASMTYLWKKPVWLSLLVSSLSLIAIHLVFRMVFQVILPQGTLIPLFN